MGFGNTLPLPKLPSKLRYERPCSLRTGEVVTFLSLIQLGNMGLWFFQEREARSLRHALWHGTSKLLGGDKNRGARLAWRKICNSISAAILWRAFLRFFVL
jgi:hypothetical protein